MILRKRHVLDYLLTHKTNLFGYVFVEVSMKNS